MVIDEVTGSAQIQDGWVFDDPKAYNEGYTSGYSSSYKGRISERVSPLVALDYVLNNIPTDQV